MTAAGTIAPVRALVIGAGVAGLQAIATARRLGAVVSGFDVRSAVQEQVESLGASFLDLGVRAAETAGGYATELTLEQQEQQQIALEERIPDFDVVITTAAILGRPAPKLIPASAVERMRRPGHRRRRRGDRRQLRADRSGRGRRAGRRLDRGNDEPSLVGGISREPALLAQRCRAPPAPGAERRARARLGGRDHRWRVRDPTRGNRVTDLPLVIELTILVLAAFLGFEVISKVPTMLHTPLMSGANFIHGIVIVGAILVLGNRRGHVHKGRRLRRAGAGDGECRRWLVRDRPDARNVQAPSRTEARRGRMISDPDVVALLYLVTIACFVVSLKFLSSPRHARKGNWVGGAGMLVAIATTLCWRASRTGR